MAKCFHVLVVDLRLHIQLYEGAPTTINTPYLLYLNNEFFISMYYRRLTSTIRQNLHVSYATHQRYTDRVYSAVLAIYRIV